MLTPCLVGRSAEEQVAAGRGGDGRWCVGYERARDAGASEARARGKGSEGEAGGACSSQSRILVGSDLGYAFVQRERRRKALLEKEQAEKEKEKKDEAKKDEAKPAAEGKKDDASATVATPATATVPAPASANAAGVDQQGEAAKEDSSTSSSWVQADAWGTSPI